LKRHANATTKQGEFNTGQCCAFINKCEDVEINFIFKKR
jgi:hypothetical protein